MNNNILNNSWTELLKAFELGLIQEEKQVEYEYRIYYAENGEIICSTCFKSDIILDNQYIIVDEETYKQVIKCSNYIIINKQLHKDFSNAIGYKKQLIPSKSGFKVVKNNPALLLDDNEVFDDIEFYAYRD